MAIRRQRRTIPDAHLGRSDGPAMTLRLSRAAHGRPAAPVRIVHLGLGNFARAHQFWYTEHATDAKEWGIAAFTGRRPGAANALHGQDGLYTLITREPAEDRFEVISTVSAVHASAEYEAYLGYLSDPEIRLVTTTVTEVGYLRRTDAGLDLDDARVRADLRDVRADPRAVAGTVPVKLAVGLQARRAASGGPVTVLPCDNLTDNGTAVARVVLDAAELIDPTLVDWIRANVSWATCMVDRITPATTDREREDVQAALGYLDASPVPTEPFSEWIISGEFSGGRPAWEDAGALVVADVKPFEHRKLRMLNGAHSLMAYAASIRGHETVADAISDVQVRNWVMEWWDAVARHLEVETEEYRSALVTRFENPRIQHRLAQIATDGSMKLPVRILPVVTEERAAGHLADGALRPIAAWVQHLRGHGAPVQDVGLAAGPSLVGRDPAESVDLVLRHLDPELGADADIALRVTRIAGELVP